MRALHILARVVTKGPREGDFLELVILISMGMAKFVYKQIKKRIKKKK